MPATWTDDDTTADEAPCGAAQEIDWEWEDWRHDAALAIRCSELQHWPPREPAGLAPERVAAVAARLDATAEAWELEPGAHFARSCPDERAGWLRRRLLGPARR